MSLQDLTVPEAVMVVVGLWESGLCRRSVRKGHLLLITGMGYHSGGGRGHLRPAVITLLNEIWVAYEDPGGPCRWPAAVPAGALCR